MLFFRHLSTDSSTTPTSPIAKHVTLPRQRTPSFDANSLSFARWPSAPLGPRATSHAQTILTSAVRNPLPCLQSPRPADGHLKSVASPQSVDSHASTPPALSPISSSSERQVPIITPKTLPPSISQVKATPKPLIRPRLNHLSSNLNNDARTPRLPGPSSLSVSPSVFKHPLPVTSSFRSQPIRRMSCAETSQLPPDRRKQQLPSGPVKRRNSFPLAQASDSGALTGLVIEPTPSILNTIVCPRSLMACSGSRPESAQRYSISLASSHFGVTSSHSGVTSSQNSKTASTALLEKLLSQAAKRCIPIARVTSLHDNNNRPSQVAAPVMTSPQVTSSNAPSVYVQNKSEARLARGIAVYQQTLQPPKKMKPFEKFSAPRTYAVVSPTLRTSAPDSGQSIVAPATSPPVVASAGQAGLIVASRSVDANRDRGARQQQQQAVSSAIVRPSALALLTNTHLLKKAPKAKAVIHQMLANSPSVRPRHTQSDIPPNPPNSVFHLPVPSVDSIPTGRLPSPGLSPLDHPQTIGSEEVVALDQASPSSHSPPGSAIVGPMRAAAIDEQITLQGSPGNNPPQLHVIDNARKRAGQPMGRGSKRAKTSSSPGSGLDVVCVEVFSCA